MTQLGIGQCKLRIAHTEDFGQRRAGTSPGPARRRPTWFRPSVIPGPSLTGLQVPVGWLVEEQVPAAVLVMRFRPTPELAARDGCARRPIADPARSPSRHLSPGKADGSLGAASSASA